MIRLVEDVFQAVADPTRRQILSILRLEGPQSIKKLAAPLPMSRQAVTKHLDILQTAGLVEFVWSGRERLHRLVAAPLREVENWLEPFEAFWDERLARLKRHLKED